MPSAIDKAKNKANFYPEELSMTIHQDIDSIIE